MINNHFIILSFCHLLVLLVFDNHVLGEEMLKTEDGEQNATKSTYTIQYHYQVPEQFTVQINAGEKKFCSFVDLEKGEAVTIKYWVNSADKNTGETHRVTMTLSNTKNGYIGGIGEIWKGTDGGSFHVMAPSTDAYEICFDGSLSLNYDRRVTFNVIIGDTGFDWAKGTKLNKLNKRKQEVNMTLQLLESLYSINRQIETLQWARKQSASQDMLKMEATLSMVDTKSYFYVFVMIFASILQVFVIRKLFEDPRR